ADPVRGQRKPWASSGSNTRTAMALADFGELESSRELSVAQGERKEGSVPRHDRVPQAIENELSDGRRRYARIVKTKLATITHFEVFVMIARTRRSGFTLVEILIVVIILGILAAIVIPQFTNASQDARESSLLSQLQTLRSQIELYKLQHKDKLPDLVTNWNPMTTKTNIDGGAVAPLDFGPHMQSAPT